MTFKVFLYISLTHQHITKENQMMDFNEAYKLTGDKQLAIELMKVEAEKVRAEALQEFVSEIRYAGIRVRID